jgi:hypothetical protein
MTTQTLISGLDESTPYALAFVLSSAVEIAAVAALFTVLSLAVLRHVRAPRRSVTAWSPVNLLQFHKLLIPVGSLALTGWVWIATQQA